MKTMYRSNSLGLLWVAIVFVSVSLAFAIANAQTTANISVQMGPGASGDQVSALQTFLASDSSIYPEGLVTGYYGDLTTAAVQRYQCKYGIVCQGDPASTGYGRVGPATLAKIATQEGTAPGGGTSLPPTGTDLGGSDIDAPILGQPSAVTTSNTAAIHWTTNEMAHNSVLYATVPPALSYESFASMSVANDPTFEMSPSVTLTNLAPNTTYYYVIESVDASGNVQYGIGNSFKTSP